MPKRKRRIVPRQPNVGAILPVVERMIAIDVLLAGCGLIIDLAAEQLGVVGRSVRRSLGILAGPTVFEIDEATGRHRHWYARGAKTVVRGQREDQATTARTEDVHRTTCQMR